MSFHYSLTENFSFLEEISSIVFKLGEYLVKRFIICMYVCICKTYIVCMIIDVCKYEYMKWDDLMKFYLLLL